MGLLQVREMPGLEIVAEVEIPDPFGDSAFDLFDYPDNNRIAVWVAAGQDGQCLYWAHYDGTRIVTEQFSGLTDTAPPVFDSSGERFMVSSEGCLKLFRFPHGPMLGVVKWPLEDDPLAEMVTFVGDNHALAQSGNGRLFLADLQQFKIVEEIHITGHAPRPTHELFPGLGHDTTPCTDLSVFYPMPVGGFLSVHREYPSASLADWRDQILIWAVPHVYDDSHD
jgi:hypothetical protein